MTSEAIGMQLARTCKCGEWPVEEYGTECPSCINDRLLAALSPGEIGCLSVALDDCKGLGDDDTTDRLAAVCRDEDIDEDLAYEIVHNAKRSL